MSDWLSLLVGAVLGAAIVNVGFFVALRYWRR